MSEAAYIHPVGWEKFQHGVKRGYPWIKVYASLMANPKWVDLTYRQRGILQSVWLLYHTSGGEVANRPHVVGGLLGDPTLTRRDLDSLNHAGFLRFSASTDREESREEKKDQEQRLAPAPPARPASPPRRKSSKSASPPALPAMTATSTQVAVRKRNPGWDYVVEVDGEPLERERAEYGRIAAELNQRAQTELNGATPDEYLELFRRRRRVLVDEWGEGKAGLRSLVKNWGPAKRLDEQGPGGRTARPGSGGARAMEMLRQANQLAMEEGR